MVATVNASTASLDQLREQIESAKLQLETAEMRSIARAIELANSQVLVEGYGDLVNVREWMYDDPANGRPIAPISLLTDRYDGQNYPVFRTEWELALIRGMARALTNLFPAAQNILENLSNYTIGTGYAYTAQARAGSGATPRLVAAVQCVIDCFDRHNHWSGGMERELHCRSRADGESLLQLIPHGWRTKAQVREPEQLVQPASPRPLEDWLGIAGEFVSSWSFGVHTKFSDTSTPLGYHLVLDLRGDDWDYVPAKRMVHVKRNVVSSVKRGVSDFYSVHSFLQRAEKLLVNTLEGSAIQAAIAFIREYAEGTVRTQADGVRSANLWNTYNRPTPLGSLPTMVAKYGAGTILDVRGMTYKAGPLGGSDGAPNFIQVIQAALRYVGVRWCMPEYMISGDASNSNMASTMVAESPFVKARESDQSSYKHAFEEVMLKVVRIAFEAGYFDQFGIDTFCELEQLIEITAQAPEVATRDRLKTAQANEIERRNGVLSARTWATESGRDYDVELKHGAKPDAVDLRQTSPAEPAAALDAEGEQSSDSSAPPVPARPAQPPPRQPAQAPASGAAATVKSDAGVQTELTLNGAQVASAIDLLNGLRTGAIAAEAAFELLVAVGIQRDRAQAMIAATEQMPAMTTGQIAADKGKVSQTPAASLSESAHDAYRRLWEAYP